MVSSIALSAALLSTSLISLAPNLILLLFPSIGKNDTADASRTHVFLVAGQALAAGGLLGDVFLHILSHAQDYEGENVGLWILAGFSIFLGADMLLRSTSSSSSSGHDHSHKHSNEQNGGSITSTTRELLLNPTVLLNIAGDAMHNFTDGLAIGASFASYTVVHSQDVTFANIMASQGGLATLSILFHEVPHELGDYCVLVKSGFSKQQAIATQFVTAIAAMVGSVVGLVVVEGWGSHSIVYLTAGGFVYLACVTILPQVLDESRSVKLRILCLLAFGMGIGFMYIVLMLEEHDHHHGGHHDHSHSHDKHEDLHHAHEHDAHSHHHEHEHHEQEL